MKKLTVRLNIDAFEEAQKELQIITDTEVAAKIGVSITQLWRAKLPIEDPRHNSPGPSFIAGVINAFGGPFEKYFFLDEVLRGRRTG